MFKRLLLCLMIFCYGGLMAQDRSIQFENTSFQEALNKAKASGKMLFVDCYTSWCGPCKRLAKDVFTKNEVADYFNKNFISFKIDCEKGEGPTLAKRFGVRGYPTMVFLDGEGKVVTKLVGGSEPSRFLDRIKKELDPETSLQAKEAKYASGIRDRALVLDLISSYKKINEYRKASSISKELLLTLNEKDLLTSEMWEVIRYYYVSTYGSKWWNFIFQHSDEYEKIVGKEALSAKVGETLHPYLFSFATGRKKLKNQAEWDEYKNFLDKYQPTNKETLYHFLNLSKAASFNDFDSYFKTLMEEIPAMDLREHFRIFTNIIDSIKKQANDKQKKQFISLMEESRKKQNSYYQDAYSTLLDQF